MLLMLQSQYDSKTLESNEWAILELVNLLKWRMPRWDSAKTSTITAKMSKHRLEKNTFKMKKKKRKLIFLWAIDAVMLVYCPLINQSWFESKAHFIYSNFLLRLIWNMCSLMLWIWLNSYSSQLNQSINFKKNRTLTACE